MAHKIRYTECMGSMDTLAPTASPKHSHLSCRPLSRSSQLNANARDYVSGSASCTTRAALYFFLFGYPPLYLAHLFALRHARRWFNSQTSPGNCTRLSNYIKDAEITQQLLYDFCFTRYLALDHVMMHYETFTKHQLLQNAPKLTFWRCSGVARYLLVRALLKQISTNVSN